MPIPSRPNTKPRMTAREQVYQTLRDWITDGTLKPNEKLSDLEISQYFSVSRTPVREAMQLLANQKLIEIHPGKESFVAPINTENIYQIYTMLAELHGMAVRFSFDKISDDTIQKLEEINAFFCSSSSEPDFAAFQKNDKKFHNIFLQLSRNDFLKNFTDTLYMHIVRIENLYYDTMKKPDYIYTEHSNIINALKKQDLELAVKEMKYNWIHTMDIFKQSNKNND